MRTPQPASKRTRPKFVDEGFVVLVQTRGGDESIQREAYVVGCSTEEKARSTVRNMYPTEFSAIITVCPTP